MNNCAKVQKDVRAAVQLVHPRLGNVGRKALCEYIKQARLGSESEILAMVSEVFGTDGSGVGGLQAGRGRGGKGQSKVTRK